ncbi:MAG TPA: hypothetical protein PKE55_03515 [Kiritimatiellia bacterium]|nr:hypothetical protein [Kiritimatiellia bacterium]
MKAILLIVSFALGIIAGANVFKWQHDQKLKRMIYSTPAELQLGYAEILLHMTQADLRDTLAGIAVYATNVPHENDIVFVSQAFLAARVEKHLSAGENDKAHEALDNAIHNFRTTYSANKNYGLLWQVQAKNLFNYLNE